ncbi:MAG: hypothetical protein CMO01_32270 [Thalassobius sp.]|nr:hypothetical protein [Thalassovita sp.]
MLKLIILIFTLLTSSLFAQPMATYYCPPCNSHCDELEFTEMGKCTHCGMTLITKEDLSNFKKSSQKTIAFYLQSGVEVLDFAGPMEVFAYAGYKVFTVSKTKDPIITQGIMKVIPDYSIEDAPKADILAFFGGNASTAYQDSKVINWVKSQEGIEYYFSVCTGAFILAESGILNDKTATTFHDALDGLENNYPKINVLKNVRFVDNGKVITTAGISAGIDGALHLVAKLQGFDIARKTAYYMEYDKWTPGEGLILAEDNPYADLVATSTLSEYEGHYEYKDNLQLQLVINEREKALEVTIGERTFPLFYLEKDKFLDLGKNVVSFQRNASEQITGYTISDTEDKVFKKLPN